MDAYEFGRLMGEAMVKSAVHCPVCGQAKCRCRQRPRPKPTTVDPPQPAVRANPPRLTYPPVSGAR